MILYPKRESILKDYEITDTILSRNNESTTYLCKQKKTNDKYALKVLKKNEKSRNEIKTQWIAQHQSEYIVAIKDIYENTIYGKKHFLVIFEYMNEGCLLNYLFNRSKPWTEKDVAKIMYQICSAVNTLHQMNISHRDIRPHNILVSEKENEDFIVKLTGFDSIKDRSKSILNSNKKELKKINYEIGCDVWSLGCILFILCFGFGPFQNYDFKDSSTQTTSISRDAQQLILDMLEKSYDKRIKLNQVMNLNWLKDYSNVNKTICLLAFKRLKENRENLVKLENEFDRILNRMRSDKLNFAQKLNTKFILNIYSILTSI